MVHIDDDDDDDDSLCVCETRAGSLLATCSFFVWRKRARVPRVHHALQQSGFFLRTFLLRVPIFLNNAAAWHGV